MATTKWTPEHAAEWARMYAKRMTLQEISEATGASIERVCYWLKRIGVALRPRNQPSKPALVRFNRKWTPEPNTGCWLWTKGTHKYGYGFFKYAGDVTAHRAGYRLYRGPIPEGMHVLHRCDVPQCVNPDHLFLGTQVDNNKDCAQKGRTQRYNASKTHCPQGHPYDQENTKVGPGRRSCRICMRVRALRWRHGNLDVARARDRASYWKKKEQSDA